MRTKNITFLIFMTIILSTFMALPFLGHVLASEPLAGESQSEANENKNHHPLAHSSLNNIDEHQETGGSFPETSEHAHMAPANFTTVEVATLLELQAQINAANDGHVDEIVITAPEITIDTTGPLVITATGLTIRSQTTTTLTVERSEGFLINHGDVLFEDLIFDGLSTDIKTAINMQVAGNVTLRNVEIKNFTNSGIRGASAQTAGSILRLESGTTIHQNTTQMATGVTGNGGGIALNNSHIYMTEGVQIINNTAYGNGGGIALGGENLIHIGTLTMTGGIIENNTATTGSGGGIHGASGRRMIISGGLVSNNRSLNGTGGGINLQGATLSTPPGFLKLSGSANIEQNQAGTNGGGISYNGGIPANNQITLSGEVVIHKNLANENGGGIHTNTTIDMSEDARIDQNQSGGHGGGVQLTAAGEQLTMRDLARIDDNQSGSQGGGIHIAGTLIMADDAQLTKNRANTSGGGTHATGSGNLFMFGNSLIDDNHAGTSGGGAQVGGMLHMADDARIANNLAHGNGGGVFLSGLGKLLDQVTIENNTSLATGGGVHIQSTGQLEMNGNSRVYGNIAEDAGGGISVALAGILHMFEQSIIENNTAATGGGVRILNTQGQFLMNDQASLYNNQAIGANPQGAGGGLSSNGTNTITDRAQIHHNRSNLQGGGIHIGATGQLIIENDADFAGIYRNHAGTSGGGIASFGTSELRSGIIQNNVAVANGGGVNVTGSGLFYMPSGAIIGNLACGTTIDNGYGGGISLTGQFFMGESMPTTQLRQENIENAHLKNPNDQTENPAATLTSTPNCPPLEEVDVSGVDFGDDTPLIMRNTAGNGGGGISANQNFDDQLNPIIGGRGHITGGRITENMALSTHGHAGGGGINLQGLHTYVMLSGEVDIEHNESRSDSGRGHGGGIRSLNGHLILSEQVTIAHNIAQGQGGGLYAGGEIPGSIISFLGGNIQNNEANRYGGGIHLTGGSTLNMASTDEENPALIGHNRALRGGGVSLYGSHMISDFHVAATIGENAIIENNEATIEGGGVYAMGINNILLETGASIIGNHAVTGGGIRLAFQSSLLMNGGLIHQNQAVASGGGISLPGASGNLAFMEMNGGEISENRAAAGGGIGFTAITDWNTLHNALNRLTIHNTGTTVARNVSNMAFNGIELWGIHGRNPDNPGNYQIRPTHYTLFPEFLAAPPLGIDGEGINRFALTNHDIQAIELTRQVFFATEGPGSLQPDDLVLTVALGDTIGDDHPFPVPVAADIDSTVCTFVFWTSSSSHHWQNSVAYPTGDPNTPFSADEIREDLTILEDTTFTAHFKCQIPYVTVDFYAPDGFLVHPQTQGILSQEEARIYLPMGTSLSQLETHDLIPYARRQAGDDIFLYWISDDASHWQNSAAYPTGDPNTSFTSEELEGLTIDQNTTFTAVFDETQAPPTTGINNQSASILFLTFALAFISVWQTQRAYRKHMQGKQKS